ncbi:MAG TPA: GNAT family N-acetyltransferase [Dehalococcoidales bacterium]|nr:GNAT family N-acetyltransferase [Dehalococcoidales bacterium]
MNDTSKNNGVRIRHKRISDAKDDYSWQTDPELARLDAAEPLTITYPQFLSEYTFDLCYPSSSRHEFAVETPDGLHIGNCVYYNVNKSENKTELGIMIGNREYWNRGYGTIVISALLDYIFNRTSLEQVYLTTLEWNQRAQKCFKKCGFQEHGTIQRDDHTFILMSINRFEWEKIRNTRSQDRSVHTQSTP